jgi:hypothetical protein
MLRRLAAELRARILGQIQKESKDALLLQGRIASWLVRSKETITSLRAWNLRFCLNSVRMESSTGLSNDRRFPIVCTVSSSSGWNCMRKRMRDSFWKTEIGAV